MDIPHDEEWQERGNRCLFQWPYFDNCLTVHEVHASVMGGVVGLVLGITGYIGHLGLAVGLAWSAIFITFGFFGLEPHTKALWTIQREPHYFMFCATVAGLLAGLMIPLLTA